MTVSTAPPSMRPGAIDQTSLSAWPRRRALPSWSLSLCLSAFSAFLLGMEDSCGPILSDSGDEADCYHLTQ